MVLYMLHNVLLTLCISKEDKIGKKIAYVQNYFNY